MIGNNFIRFLIGNSDRSDIDKVRSHSSHPTETYVNISIMMKNSLSDLNYFLNDFRYTLLKNKVAKNK